MAARNVEHNTTSLQSMLLGPELAALVARGEFSIVIAGLAVAAGREPALGPLATAYVLILAVLGPILARTSEPLRVGLTRLVTALGGRRSARRPADAWRPREP